MADPEEQITDMDITVLHERPGGSVIRWARGFGPDIYGLSSKEMW